jgi:hypothetical protein
MITRCRHCDCLIDTQLGEIPPNGEHHAGTTDDPRAPGDYDNVCDVCNYDLGLRGGPLRPGDVVDPCTTELG